MSPGRVATGIALVTLVVAYACTPDAARAAAAPRWKTDVGLEIDDIATDDTGLTVVAGQTLVDDRQNYLVTALDPSGAELWSDTFQPIPYATSGTWAEAVALDRRGRTYAVGNGWHCRFGCEAGFWFIRAYASDGTVRWARGVNGWKHPLQRNATGVDVWRNGIVVSGFVYDDNVGATRSWVRSFGFDGKLRWVRSVEIAGRSDIRLTANGIAATPNGTSFVAGSVEPDVGLGVDHDQEPFIQRLSVHGTAGWTRVFREPGDADDDAAYAVDVHGRSVVVGGALGSGLGHGQPAPHLGWLARLSLDGEQRWMRTRGVEHQQVVEDVAIAPSGQILTAGGIRTADWSVALILRTYDAKGRLLSTWGVNPAKGSLVGTAVSADAAGISVGGISYGNAYLDPGVGGRVWRF